ncbi:MAG: hypothetical protein JEZ02_01595 [Desulfatibacillum sp.]|nr:hypothetical protein [Desulfatibacillum sp.]
MAVTNSEAYTERLKQISPRVFILGEKVDQVWNHPLFRSSINQLSKTYDYAFDPKHREHAIVHSPLVDEPVRRLGIHIQTSKEDSLLKVKMTREICAERLCTQCMSNTMSSVWCATYDAEEKYGEPYHQRFVEFIKYLQKTDKAMAWGMMDPKGDRRLKASEQKPFCDMRIVERNAKGIVVTGAKAHTTLGPVCEEIVVAPCRSLTAEDKDFAVSFAIPVDTQGVTFICRPAPGSRTPMNMEKPIGSSIGAVEAMTVFQDVFVPWDRVFLCGEWDMNDRVPMYFAGIHRQSKCACLAGHTDLIIGIAALTARVNGLDMKATHIRDKITRLMIDAEAAYGCSLGAGEEGHHHPSGVWVPDFRIANAGLNNIRSQVGNHLAALHDIAGGVIVTMPTEHSYNHPELKELMDVYFQGGQNYTTKERLRALHLCQEVCASNFTGYFLGWAINAAGSLQTNEMAVRAAYDLEKRVNIAKGYAQIA